MRVNELVTLLHEPRVVLNRSKQNLISSLCEGNSRNGHASDVVSLQKCLEICQKNLVSPMSDKQARHRE